MSRQAGESSGRGNGGSSSSSGSSGAAAAPGSSNEVAVSSVVGATGVALILNLDRADDSLSNGGAAAS